MSNGKTTLMTVILALALAAPLWNDAVAGPVKQSKWLTLSARGVILVGQTFVDVSFTVPKCRKRGREFLVLGVTVSPEVTVGATSRDVVNLPNWAVSVPVYQVFGTAGATKFPLTALGQGPEHIFVMLPAGQSLAGFALAARVTLLGGATATRRFEFNVHITGACGTASR